MTSCIRHLPTLDAMTALYSATEDERRDALARSLLDRPAAESRAMWQAWQRSKPAAFLADMRRRIDTERARRAETRDEGMAAMDAPDVPPRATRAAT